mgnify:CR=1 FL=1
MARVLLTHTEDLQPLPLCDLMVRDGETTVRTVQIRGGDPQREWDVGDVTGTVLVPTLIPGMIKGGKLLSDVGLLDLILMIGRMIGAGDLPARGHAFPMESRVLIEVQIPMVVEDKGRMAHVQEEAVRIPETGGLTMTMMNS